MSYYPKRPVKSFQDLEVYQKLLAIAVAIVKRIAPERPAPEVASAVAEASPNETGTEGRAIKRSDNIGSGMVKDLHDCVLSLPVKIAAAHSLRFGNSEQAIRILEEIMVGCNKIVVYLELYRDLYNDNKIETEFFEEQIKNILSTRFKILHLQRSWIKFTPKVKNQ